MLKINTTEKLLTCEQIDVIETYAIDFDFDIIINSEQEVWEIDKKCYSSQIESTTVKELLNSLVDQFELTKSDFEFVDNEDDEDDEDVTDLIEAISILKFGKIKKTGNGNIII